MNKKGSNNRKNYDQVFRFAGFSTNTDTWLKVNDNYKTVNLAAEKKDKNSFYTLYKKVSTLRKSPYLKGADLTTKVLSENVFAFAR